jgi:type II secretory pathway component PulF
MQCIMVNRKLFGNFEFSAPFQKRSIFLLFVSLLFLLFWINYRKQKHKRKNRIFALKCPFLSQIKR